MSAKVALVTGANRGIGLEIVRQLLKKFNGTVLLAARNIENGLAAVKLLQSEGLAPEFLQLDVSDKDSIDSARRIVTDKYGRLDVLVNNAGIMMNVQKTDLAYRAKKTIDVNFFGTLHVTQAFWDLLQPNSRIVNLSSGLGSMTLILGEEWQVKLSSPELTIDRLIAYMNKYIQDAASPDISKTGWHTNMVYEYSDSYSVSKIAINRLTLLHAKLMQNDPRVGILVNCVCPGWVRTDMGGANATKSIEEGADTSVYLALLPPGTTVPQGKFLRERKILKHYL